MVRAEQPLALLRMSGKAEVFTYESGGAHNAFEQTAYIGDAGRVWIITLSAKNADALARSLPAFRELVQSYGGSILMDSPSSK